MFYRRHGLLINLGIHNTSPIDIEIIRHSKQSPNIENITLITAYNNYTMYM